MLLYLIISQTRPRAEFRINEEKETAPRFVLSWISHFIKSENVEREREREIHVYTHTRIGSIREKTRFAPTLFDFERTTEIYALAIPSVCNKETKTRRQYMYRIRYRMPLEKQRERKKIMIMIEL